MNFRYFLARIGEHLNADQIRNAYGIAKYLEIGHLMRKMGWRVNRPGVWAKTRHELFDLVAQEVRDKDVLYLEFGVHKGDTTRYWANLLTNPRANLHGFDSFEGLPEDWNEFKPRGTFSTGGQTPAIDDPRVRFFKGWFSDTLPAYSVPEHEVLVLNLDADLFTSTMDVFKYIGPYIVPGTYLYFDEFNDPDHELRAFVEFAGASQRRFELRGATPFFTNVVFQCVA
jgi:Macrocin-O-methyltransferase (TylF)